MTAFDQASRRPRWRCALIGGEPLLIQCATMLIERGHEVTVLISRRAGIRRWAEAHDIAVRDRIEQLLDPNIGPIDHLFSITNLAILPPALLELPSGAAINFHDGPMPEMAGLNTPVWALLSEHRQHGVTWHLMEERIDAGAILAQQSFPVEANESAYSINTKCFAAGVESFSRVLDMLEDGRPVLASGCAPKRYFGREQRPPAMATIDWNESAGEIASFIRHLDYADHGNPMGAPKFRVGQELVLVNGASVEAQGSTGALAGTITRAEHDRLCVATGSGELRLTRLATVNGEPITEFDAIMRYRLRVGMVLESEPEDRRATISALDASMATFEPWWRSRLAECDPLFLDTGVAAGTYREAGAFDQFLDGQSKPMAVVAALVAFLGRITDRDRFSVAYADPVMAAMIAGAEPWFAPSLPLLVTIDFEHGLDQLFTTLSSEVRALRRRIGHTRDLPARYPELINGSTHQVSIVITAHPDDVQPTLGLTIAVAPDGGMIRWCHGTEVDGEVLASLASGFPIMLEAASRAQDRAIGGLPLMQPADLKRLVAQGCGPDDEVALACMHEMFAQAAHRTPNAPAVTSRGVTLSYSELDARSNQLANYLQSLNVGPNALVGLHLERSVELVVALVAIHKAGGAYVPLDPAYPRDRIAYMVRDAKVGTIVTQERIADLLPATDASVVRIDTDREQIAAASSTCPKSGVEPADLAYVIYTSGSTGLPKGVMVEHRNVASFFSGMDAVVTPGGTWLAVTSLSFDISVLELCWTLTRGCHVVITTGDELRSGGSAPTATRKIDFSLFYFASADGDAADQYRLLLDGARFADAHGFTAVWTPERHFHAFGGLFPNPAVTSAAVAAVTRRVAIRGGSVVVPLHHPIRVAEEWSLVDNLSGGRVGIAFASGWQPNDFVLRPESFADKTRALAEGIDIVRGLWRGETRSFPGPLGASVDVAIYPRPVQRELPFWITSAGNADTFAAAGRLGANVLTHLLGQSVEELAEKIAVYRQARRTAGHDGDGQISLMLHTFVGQEEEAVRAAVRQPLIDYLRTSTSLVKQFAWSFPAFRNREGTANLDLGTLSEEEMSGLLDHAFERYYETGGLFGTPERCRRMVELVRGIGVDEIGCLIDFGIPVQQALDHLPALDELRQRSQAESEPPTETLGRLMKTHHVTHLQCTPSMAQMLASDEEGRAGLATLRQIMVGGETFPPALAAELNGLVGGSVHNMYGPTETTIWSSTHVVGEENGCIPLGQALKNQQLHILDSRGQPLPAGAVGELVIGGHGVVRGYLDRPLLTAERFVAHPFNKKDRAYRTGDLARRHVNGTLEFLGRADHQVKIRGHRIELGEIEAVLGAVSGVERAIVVAREDMPGDVRLTAYVVAKKEGDVAISALRDHLTEHFPEFMVPAHLVMLPVLPRLPNGKIDRSALPPPEIIVAVANETSFVAPEDGVEQTIAAIWRDVLSVGEVGTRDNFFDIGGHSLLAVQVNRRLRDALGRQLPLTDIFRFPTIRALAAHIGSVGDNDPLAAVPTRAATRRAAIQRRRGLAPATSRVDA